MTVSIDDCAQAGKDVINSVRMYLPIGFLAKYSVENNIGSYYNILSAADYKKQFDAFYDGFFAATFGKGAMQAASIPAFATPAPHYHRKIYIQDPIGANKGTIRHEFFHWLQHYNFYPTYYISQGTKSADVVEGVTEYFTRRIITGRTSYQAQYTRIVSLINKEPSLVDLIGAASFLGDTTAIEKIHSRYWANSMSTV